MLRREAVPVNYFTSGKLHGPWNYVIPGMRIEKERVGEIRRG